LIAKRAIVLAGAGNFQCGDESGSFARVTDFS
jgi:hypothetical protein